MPSEEIKKRIKEIRDLAQNNPDEFLKFIKTEEFKSLTEKMYSPSSQTGTSFSVDYIKEIGAYTVIAIGLYVSAIPHKTINSIKLLFSDIPQENIQPLIDIELDSAFYHIDIENFWNNDTISDYDGKKECQTGAECVWCDFRNENPDIKMNTVADNIRLIVADSFPQVPVCYELK